MKKVKKVLCFGTFDKVHSGHISFLRQARALGETLVVAVSDDNVVNTLKGRFPLNTQSQRIKEVDDLGIADLVVGGDSVIGSGIILDRIKPNLIALGYDQQKLGEFVGDKVQVVYLEPFQPNVYKSSLLNKYEKLPNEK